MKRRWLATGLLAAMVGLLALSQQAAEGVRQGLQLCAWSVIPALFPFFVLSSLHTEILTGTGGHLLRLPGRLLGYSSTGIRIFFLSLLGGYPVGPRLIGQLCRAGRLSREEATQLLAFCNNAGPAFILGLVGLGQFGSLHAGVALYLIHAAAAALTALRFRAVPAFPDRAVSAMPAKPLASALVSSIADAGTAMVQICSFVTFFNAILWLPPCRILLAHPLLLGAVELTQGIVRLPNTLGGFVMASVLLAWGGLSVHCQTAAVLAQTDISLGQYFKGKLCQTVFSAGLALLVGALLQ